MTRFRKRSSLVLMGGGIIFAVAGALYVLVPWAAAGMIYVLLGATPAPGVSWRALWLWDAGMLVAVFGMRLTRGPRTAQIIEAAPETPCE